MADASDGAMFPPPRPVPAPRGGTVGWFVLALAIAFIWTVGYLPTLIRDIAKDVRLPLTPESSGAAYGEIAGSSLALAAVVWAVLFFAVVRKRAPARAAVYFVVLWLMVGGLDILGFNLAIGAAGRGNADAKLALQQFRAALADIGRGDGDKAASEITISGGGPIGQTAAMLRQLIVRVVADHNAYRQELIALGFPELMKPESLAHENLPDAEARLNQALGVVQKYRALNSQRLEDFKTQVSASSLDPVSKQDVSNGISQIDPRAREHLWDDEEAILKEYVAAVDVLARSRRAWRLQGGKLIFTDASVMSAYNTHILAARSDAAEEKAARSAEVSDASQRLGNEISRAP